jgi:rod shape-determining protein MreC
VSRIKQRFFIACLGLALAIALFTGVFAVMGWGSLLRDVGSAVIYPFQWVFSKVDYALSGFGDYLSDVDGLLEEIESLKAENQALRGELVDAQIRMDENEWLYQYLSIKDGHEDYSLCAASVISSSSVMGDGGAYVTELTLNQGTSSGVEAGMPVITPLGLVGVVVEVGLNHCRVSTMLDTSVSVGAVTTRATENGLCEGDYVRVHNGCALLRQLPEEADVEIGDIVVTSGRGSVYPYGIPIGRVTEVSANAYSRTTEATVQPFTDFSDLTQVVILTQFIHYVDGYGTAQEDEP